MKNSLIALVVLMASLCGWDVRSDVFANPSTITFSTITPAGVPGVSAPYPSTITVSNLSGTISNLTVTLTGINHHRPDDIQVLLVGPTGAKYVLLADAGGTSVTASGVDLTFDDAAGSQVANSGPLDPGTFQPTCVDFQNTINTDFSVPAPAGPYSVAAPRGSATLASVFNGTDPNGTWSLYTVDDIANPTPVNIIAGGWSLDITTGAIQSTVTTLAATPNPSFTTAPNDVVTFTATVTSNGVPVGSQGTVTFKEGATTLAGPTNLNASGQASFVTSTLGEGSHTVSAFYNGTASLNLSDGSTTQMVNNHTTVSSNQFWNLGLISIPDTGSPSTPTIYPSQMFVSGLTGTISKVSVTLSNVAHINPDDLKLLLVGPTGAQLVLLGNVGGAADIVSTTLTLDDTAPSLLPDTDPIVPGTFKPSFVASSAAVFPVPAPAGPYNQPATAGAATLASAFNGDDPNGTWSLYVVDDIAGNGSGSIEGWGLEFITSGDEATITTIVSTNNPSLVGESVTFVAKVEKSSDNSAVTNGTVTFREGATVLGGPVALDGSGTAAFNTAALSEGPHVVSADYSGSPGAFNVSSGDITQTVDAATVVSGTSFCNPAALQVVSGQTPGAYPSRILVTNLGAGFCDISVTISNLSINTPDDVELLLVSPTGEKFVLLSDAGGTITPVVNTTLVFSDTAGSTIPDTGPMLSGTFLPTDVSSTPAAFPSPAPAPPYMHPAPTGGATLNGTFGGSDPNGYWSLYVVDDVLGAPTPNIADGWCLNFNYPPVATVGGPQAICSGSTTAGLGGNPPVSGTGAWSVESGGTGIFNPNASTPDATFTHTGGSGPITLRWTLTDAVCGVDAADVEVTLLTPPSVPAIVATPASPHTGSSGNQASGPAGLTAYAWTISNGTITSATNVQTITYTAGGNGAVTLGLTVFNVSGCSANNSILVPITTPGPGDPLPASYTADTTFLDAPSLVSTRFGLAFDGTNYWSCSGGGSSGIRFARYDALGAELNTYSPGLDFRSVFTAPDGTLLARAYNSPIIYQQTSPGVFTNSGVSLTGGTLNSQSAVVLNSTGTEYLAASSGTVSRWSTNGTYLGSVSLQGFGSVSDENTYPQNIRIAVAGAFWLTYNGNQILSIWDTSGNRLAQAILTGAGSSFSAAASFSYCNGKAWVVDDQGGTWRGYDIFAPVRVAVLAAESNASYREDVATQILAAGDIFEVDIIPVQAGNPVPTLADLSRYRAVLVFSNPYFNDNVAMGDLLADYVDQGGVAVLATFTFYESLGLGIQGRLKTDGYLPFSTAGQAQPGGLTLIKDLPQHPLLFDVVSFDGGNSYHNSPISITNGSTLVASWSNGQPLVGARKAGPGGVVGLNFFPPSSDAIGGGWDAATDGGRLMANALRWTGQHPPVILTHPVGDHVFAGAAVAFDVSVTGSAPLDLQWRKDGIDLPGQTGTILAFTAQVSSTGEYSLVASNAFGVATSSNATLTVISSTNVTVTGSDRGWYRNDGFHSPASVNHFVGNSSSYYHNWFVFDIPPLAGPIARAELRLHTYNVLSPTGSETYQLHEVTTPAATVQAGGSGLTNIYNDLGDGPVYAARTFVTGEAQRDVSIVLNQTLRTAVAAAAGGSFVFGGEVASLDADPATAEGAFGGSSGGLLELILTVGTGDQPVAGYFTDNDEAQTGLVGPIQNAGFTPLHIGNIATQDFSGLRLLLLNERSGSTVSAALTSRLPDIEAWVRAGGRLIIHDRSAGNVSPNPFLLGTPGLGTVPLGTANLDLIQPATTLVTAGPFGLIDDTTLDGGNWSAYGYIPTTSLPSGARAILSTAPNQVACFSYPLGAGFIYYSTIPLDCYLPGGDCGALAIAPALTDIYTPNVISYTHELYAPLRFLTPGPAVGGVLPLFLAGADGTPISPIRVPQISVHSAPDLTAPVTWTLLPNPMVLDNGLLRVDGLNATNSPSTFFRAVEVP